MIDPAQTWDQWLAEHIKTCETCRLSFEEMEGGMCPVAFEKVKEYAKKEKS